VDVWRECLRVIKPGGHLLAFGGSRTYHRLACAIEDAGFEIRDQIQWIYGSGFPKSANISKNIDKAAGAEREVVGSYTVGGTAAKGKHKGRAAAAADEGSAIGCTKELSITAPATPAAKQWDGWGTALKPAHEPIVVARKPFKGTVAANVLEWGTGGINVDGCRVGTSSTPRKDPRNGNLTNAHLEMRPWMKDRIKNGEPLKGDFDGAQGRFPANVIHDGSDEVVGLFPQSTSSDKIRRNNQSKTSGSENGAPCYGKYNDKDTYGYSDSGSAARFFYCAKASKADRDEGLDGMELRDGGFLEGNADKNNARKIGARPDVLPAQVRNHHPTVKPTALMRYLCRLVTPPNGVILDPFTGSGSTGKGAVLEGFDFIGIEREAEYIEIAKRRIGAILI
jgi:site-specific DNA-methyltransferase (adenine-specific)